jgi:hypothetical protein
MAKAYLDCKARHAALADGVKQGWHSPMGLVRLFLAFVVAVDHWRVTFLIPRDVNIDDAWKFGFNPGYAVMFFYVISGFLITYTLMRNYRPGLAGVAAFYRNRFIRIFLALLAARDLGLRAHRRGLGKVRGR